MIESALQTEISVCGRHNGKIEFLKSGLLSEKNCEMNKSNVKKSFRLC